MGTDAYKIAPHQLPAPRFHEKIQFPAQEQKDLIAVMAVKIRGLDGGKLYVLILTGKILVQMQKYFLSGASMAHTSRSAAAGVTLFIKNGS